MPQERKQAPPLDTAAGLLLTLTALSGEFPTVLVSRLSGGDAYKMKVVKRLKKDGLLRTYYADGLRGFRLTSTAKRLLLADLPEQFCPYLTGCSETNTLKSELTRRLRLHRMAEVLVTMHNAGVSAFPWQKPDVFGPTPPPDDTRIEWPVYYSSREVKEIGSQQEKIRGSRATGVLLTSENVLAVYNTGATEMKWEQNAELRLRVLLMMDLCKQRLLAQYSDADQGAVVFGAGMEQMPALMGVGGDKRHKYFVLDEHYRHFYYLTSDHRGEVVLRLLCDPNKRAMLDNILREGLSEPQPNWFVENDAMDGDEPVLFEYSCDMPRIRRFCGGLNAHKLKGTLYCFDFQEKILSQICGPNVAIECIDFENLKNIYKLQGRP